VVTRQDCEVFVISISAEGIKPFLDSPDIAENIKVYPIIGSTNREAREQAVRNPVHGTVIIADCQTQGKGRFDRVFFSPPGSGLYMSFVLFSDIMGFANPTAITAYAAVRVCEAIDSVCDINMSIKWVNDIYLNRKKIGGILAEAITDSNSHGAVKIILGIGINVSTKTNDFPEEIRRGVSSLYPEGNPSISRNLLAAAIINRIILTDAPDEREVLSRYKERLFILGSDITVVQGNKAYEAKALDINEYGHLIVKMKDGQLRALLSGDVRLEL